MELNYWGICTAVLSVIIVVILLQKERMRKYWSRSCTGSVWLRRFPQCSKENIRDFLNDFVDSFVFPKKNRLKFGPDDKVIDIYKTKYPGKIEPDAMEIETLFDILEEKYGIDFYAFDKKPDITLGELFEMAMKSNIKGDKLLLLSKEQKIIIGVVIGLVLLLFCLFVWPTLYRYDKTQMGDSREILLMRTNRITGQTEIYFPSSGWVRNDR